MPAINPVTNELESEGFVITGVLGPDKEVQFPVPFEIVLPCKLNCWVVQIVKSAPARGAVGRADIFTFMVSLETGQGPFETSQMNWLEEGIAIVVTIELFVVVEVTVPVPLKTIQRPVPVAGIVAARVVAEVSHKF